MRRSIASGAARASSGEGGARGTGAGGAGAARGDRGSRGTPVGLGGGGEAASDALMEWSSLAKECRMLRDGGARGGGGAARA